MWKKTQQAAFSNRGIGSLIGAVNSINALPYLLPLQQWYTITRAPPSQLNAWLRSGTMEWALSSSVLACDPHLCHLSDFGIASSGPVLSVHLYSSVPPQALSRRRILLDPASTTSVALLRLLCKHHWHVTPQFVNAGAHDAKLLIGDSALKHPSLPGYLTIDLASAWHEMTLLPFVFALFVGSPMTAWSTTLPPHLEKALIYAETHLETIIDTAVQQIALPRERLLTYFQQSSYRLGRDEQRGLAAFKELYVSDQLSTVDSGTLCEHRSSL